MKIFALDIVRSDPSGFRTFFRVSCWLCLVAASGVRSGAEVAKSETPPPGQMDVALASLALDGPITLRADRLSGSAGADGELSAEGHVELTRGDAVIQADRVDVDMVSQEVTATGRVHVRFALGLLDASTLRYEAHGVSSGTQLVGSIGGFSIRARSFSITPRPGRLPIVVATQGALTSCDFVHPDYLLSARKITLIPGQSVRASGVGLSLFGIRLFTVPSVNYKLKDGERRAEGSTLPTLGKSAASGVFLHSGLDVSPIPGTTDVLDLNVSERLGLTGGLRMSDIGGTPVQAVMLYRQENPRLADLRLTVDRLPEVKAPILYSLSRDGGSLATTGELVAGRYTESTSHDADGRLLTRIATLWRPGVPQTSHPIVAVGLTDGQYSHGNYFIGGAGIGYKSSLGRDFDATILYQLNTSIGRTPFYFDRLETPSMVTLHLVSLKTRWGWNVSTTYDLAHHTIYDAQISISHLLKCIRPMIGYHLIGRQILFGAAIPAFENVGGLVGSAKRPPRSPLPVHVNWTDGEALPTLP